MGVLIVSAVFPPEPVVSAQISIALARELSKELPVTVISPYPTRPNGVSYENIDFEKENFKHIIANSYTCPASNFAGRLRESISFGRATAQYIRLNHDNISVIYANTWPLFAQSILVKEATKWQIPIVVHIQDIYPESMINRLGIVGKIIPSPLRQLDRWMLSRATHILTISENMKSYICKSRCIDFDKVSVVRNWQQDHCSIAQDITDHNKFTFMYVGSISPAAGVLLLIKSFIEADISNSRLVIAGSGSEKRMCMEYAQRYPNADIVFRTVEPCEVPSVQSQADILLLPLKRGISHTASPSKLPAYMLSAKPIIACVDGGSDVEMIINKSRCGWVSEPENQESLAELMRTTSKQNSSTLADMGNSARLYALDHFTQERNLKILTTKIQELHNGDQRYHN